MTSSGSHWKLGLFVVAISAGAAGGLIWLGAAQIGRESLEVVTYFDESVQGLDVGSPVKFRGVPIGTVSGIGIAPDRRHVEARTRLFVDELERMGLRRLLEYDASPPGRQTGTRGGEAPRFELASAGITGVRFLQVDFFDATDPPARELPFEPPGNYFPSRRSTLKTLEAALADLTGELPKLLTQAGHALTVTSETLDTLQETLRPLVAREGPVFAALTEIRVAAQAFERGIEELRLADTGSVLRETGASMQAASGAVSNAAGSFSSLAVDVSGLTEEMRSSLAQMAEALEAVRALADYLERDPAALVRGRAPVTPVLEEAR